MPAHRIGNQPFAIGDVVRCRVIAAEGVDLIVEPMELIAPAGGVRREPAAGEQVPLWNLANLLTMSRMVLVPVFVLALFAQGGSDPAWRIAAAVIFGVASLTDRLRRRPGPASRPDHQVRHHRRPYRGQGAHRGSAGRPERIGRAAVVDHRADRRAGAGVTALRFWVLRYGVIPASRGGKVKAFAQAVAIELYVLPLPPVVHPVRWAAMGIAVLLTVITGVDYVARALRLRASGRRAVVLP